MGKFSRVTADDIRAHSIHELEPGDQCWYWRYYTVGAGYAHSDANQLITNLKILPSEDHRLEHRTRAIDTVALVLAEAITPGVESELTFIPIPPSKVAGDPGYNDRLWAILTTLKTRYLPHVDIRRLIQQHHSTPADHETKDRQSINEIYQNYIIDRTLLLPTPQKIIVFDDVLTSGRHFKAMQRKLQECYPEVPIYGLFITRAINVESL